MIYDTTAGTVETPGGIGKFVEYDSAKGAVTVEIGHRWLVCFPADECFFKDANSRFGRAFHKSEPADPSPMMVGFTGWPEVRGVYIYDE